MSQPMFKKMDFVVVQFHNNKEKCLWYDCLVLHVDTKWQVDVFNVICGSYLFSGKVISRSLLTMSQPMFKTLDFVHIQYAKGLYVTKQKHTWPLFGKLITI
jgi:hypothetical protein